VEDEEKKEGNERERERERERGALLFYFIRVPKFKGDAISSAG
jgi:hypothetical protein